MRGCKWAYNDPESLSGSIITLKELKKMGSNANFFGHLLQSGKSSNYMLCLKNL